MRCFGLFIFLKKQHIYNFIFVICLVISLIIAITNHTKPTIPTSSTILSGRIIVIDAGHGTPDSGTVGYSGSKEKDINLSVAKRLGNLFIQSGAHVVYTREDDGTIAENLDDTIRNIKRNDMAKRKDIRDNSGADLFISVHMNYFTDPKYRGAQVFYKGSCTESKKLAELIQKNIKEFIDVSNTREAKNSENKIFILNDSKLPSVLVECGFLSNPEEEKNLLNSSYQNDMAYAIFGGVLKYFSIT